MIDAQRVLLLRADLVPGGVGLQASFARIPRLLPGIVGGIGLIAQVIRCG